jgi:transcriptional regulator with XRE-family HTH domain
MTVRRSPTVRRRRLGLELRRLREATELTIERVAEILECSDSKISRIETGQVGATARDVRDMLELYGVNGIQRDKLVQIAREGRQKGWWHTYDDTVLRALIGFEAEATTIRTYSALLVPGLLQTVDYARAITRAVRPDLSPEEVEGRVKVRTARQVHLMENDPPTHWVILDEAVLRRVVGGREVMDEQVQHLLKAAASPWTTLRVLPFKAREHAGMDGSFVIYGFPEVADPDVVYLENATSDLYLEKAEEVRRYTALFDHLRGAALTPEESVALLATSALDLE